MDRKIENKGWNWRRWVPMILIGALLAYFGINIYQDSGTSRLNVQQERLLLDTVERGIFQEFIPVTGVVLPIRTVLIGAVEGGRVEGKLVEDGVILKAGQKILELSNPDLQLNYLNQEANIVAQINQTRSNTLLMEQQSLNLKETALTVDFQIDLLSKRVARNKSLYKDGVIPEVEFQETEDELEHFLRRRDLLRQTIKRDSASAVLQQDQMENSLDLMKRNLEIAKKSLENLIVRAPIDGQLSGLTAELGELIIESSQIAQIDDLSNFKIRVQIDEFYIARIFTGQNGSFQFAGKTYELTIQKIFPQVLNGAFAADMLFTGQTPEGIKRGQTLSVKLALSVQEEALLLARGGFYQTTGGNWVYVVDGDAGTAHKRNIKINRQSLNHYEITGGLEPGDVVITSSYDNFGDNDELVLKQ
ncbi:MAG: HlyD family efflux transporter periplasmic adaptor subunit [Saprospiraceae bacterium]|nr:HlyD family efflux transporter periplasmic adaptor subunit [Saprospiraceae bacterium]